MFYGIASDSLNSQIHLASLLLAHVINKCAANLKLYHFPWGQKTSNIFEFTHLQLMWLVSELKLGLLKRKTGFGGGEQRGVQTGCVNSEETLLSKG